MPIPVASLCLAPAEAYGKIVQKGADSAAAPTIKVFHQSFVGGCYIGFGGLLSMVIGGQLPSSDPGIQKFVFAALFPGERGAGSESFRALGQRAQRGLTAAASALLTFLCPSTQ